MQKNKQIMVAIPSYSGDVPLRVISRLNNMIMPEGYDANFAYTERVPIDKARHGIAHMCLIHDNDYLFFCDSDQIPSRNAIDEFIKLDKDIVGCPIPSRRGEKFIAVFDENIDRLTEWKGTKQCGALGMATTMIKRHVVEELMNKWSNPFAFECEQNDKGVWVEYSEDVMFCRRARDLGFEVWCTDKVNSEHIGDPVTYWYDGEYKNSFNHKL